jgi:hypothetical protein
MAWMGSVDGLDAEATSIIRSLLTEIRLIPQDGLLAFFLVGALAGLLFFGKPTKGGPINAKSHPEAAINFFMFF